MGVSIPRRGKLYSELRDFNGHEYFRRRVSHIIQRLMLLRFLKSIQYVKPEFSLKDVTAFQVCATPQTNDFKSFVQSQWPILELQPLALARSSPRTSEISLLYLSQGSLSHEPMMLTSLFLDEGCDERHGTALARDRLFHETKEQLCVSLREPSSSVLHHEYLHL